MGHPLCVLTPEIGVLSETFIQWDIDSLLPGRTVVVADPPPRGATVVNGPTWDTKAPRLVFTPLTGDPLPSVERRAELRRFIHRHGVEVVVVEFLDFACRWFDTLRELDVRVWLRGHGADLSSRLNSSYAQFATAAGITVPSQAAAARLAEVGLPRELVHVVPNHVDVPPRSRLSRPRGSVIRCVTIGRLVPKKGHQYLLDAFRLAHDSDPRLRLDIVGDGPLRPDLEHQIAGLHLHDSVQLLGALRPQEIARQLDRSDIYLHHAVTAPDGETEGQPLAILEAMAASLPCVLTRHEGIPELVEDGVSGVLVDERDIDTTAKAIIELAADPTARQRLGHAAWRRAQARHSHDNVRTSLLGLLGLAAS